MSLLQHPSAIPSAATTAYSIGNSIMFSSLFTYADSSSLFYDLIGTSDGWAANSNAGTNARKLTV